MKQKDYRILYKFATRSRPDKFFKCLDNIQQFATHDNYLILVTADCDDPSMFNDEVNNRIKEYKKVEILYGNSKNKIDAINRDLALYPDWEILINMSDDMEFIQHGFDKIIIEDFKKFNSLDLLLHYPDQSAGHLLPTMAIMGKTYFNRFGYIYNPEYKSLWCDNEQMQVAIKLGKYKFIKKRLFNHNHPTWGLSEKDEQYRITEGFYYEDQATFNRRKASNFFFKPAEQMIVSVLICSINSRVGMLTKLLRHLDDQIVKLKAEEKVEVIVNLDNKEKSTGKKRQELLEDASGKYVIFIDDDDWVSDNYVEELLKAAESDADCFAINGWMTTNGHNKITWRLSKDYENVTVKEKGWPVYLRTTNHITAVKREIALLAGFPDKSNAEDKAYSEKIKHLVKSEFKIQSPMYHYRYSTHNKEYV